MLTCAPKSRQCLVRAQVSAACPLLVLFSVTAAVAGSVTQSNKCEGEGKELQVVLGLTSKTVSFICPTALPNLLPSKEQDAPNFHKCFAEKECRNEKEFSEVVGAEVALVVTGPAQAREPQEGTTYTVTAQKLPETTKKVYLQCTGTTGSSLARDLAAQPKKNCTVEVTVPAKPSADTCAEEKGIITVEVDPTGKSATFKCGGDLTSIQPKETTKVYTDDCSTAVSLDEELPSATLTVDNLMNTLALTELPKAEKTLCYKCVDAVEGSTSTKECRVKVKVPSSGSPSVATHASTSILAVVVLAIICFH
ncbi:sag-related sequence srs53f [Cystoisospora suis]|uniref:Sag-related sequence srs53f n=1 Tax=Cystoisospora suis TaxID=483139 RepID=A0A2C6KQH4_9APIC|nr:sag-related sequence srs53f [Cystoisospora suis]